MTEEEALIDYAIRQCSDLIPYDDPDYDEKLLRLAKSYVKEELNPDSELNKLCAYHDKYFLEEPDFG